MKRSRKVISCIIPILLLLTWTGLLAGCKKEEPVKTEPEVTAEEKTTEAEPFKIAVVVPGVAAGSPLYEQLVEGSEKAVAEYPNASMKVVELGFNQAEWTEKNDFHCCYRVL